MKPAKHFIRVMPMTEEEYNELNHCTWEDLSLDDYRVFGFYSLDDEKLIYLNDNIHDNPLQFWKAYVKGIRSCGFEVYWEDFFCICGEGEEYSTAAITAICQEQDKIYEMLHNEGR